MELQGKVIAVLPERSGVSARGEWKTQEYVVEYQEGQYPRKLHFSVIGAERIARFNIQIGQTVNVAFDIDAHEWNGRWFTDIRAFDVRLVDPNSIGAAPQAQNADPFGAPAPTAPFAEPTEPAATANNANTFAAEDIAENPKDDMPF